MPAQFFFAYVKCCSYQKLIVSLQKLCPKRQQIPSENITFANVNKKLFNFLFAIFTYWIQSKWFTLQQTLPGPFLINYLVCFNLWVSIFHHTIIQHHHQDPAPLTHTYIRVAKGFLKKNLKVFKISLSFIKIKFLGFFVTLSMKLNLRQ